jgi:hypothetical protein
MTLRSYVEVNLISARVYATGLTMAHASEVPAVYKALFSFSAFSTLGGQFGMGGQKTKGKE